MVRSDAVNKAGSSVCASTEEGRVRSPLEAAADSPLAPNGPALQQITM